VETYKQIAWQVTVMKIWSTVALLSAFESKLIEHSFIAASFVQGIL
jgi:hypothetical protein